MRRRRKTGARVEAHDDEAEAYEKCREVLASTPKVGGVYVSTANSMPVMNRLSPHVVMRSNLKLFLERIRSDTTVVPGGAGRRSEARTAGSGSIATFADEVR